TQCLPQRLLAPERSSATNATSHASPSATDHRLLEAIFFVVRMTLYYAGVSSCSAPRDLVGLREFQRDHNSRATCESQCLPTPSERVLSRRCGRYHPVHSV